MKRISVFILMLVVFVFFTTTNSYAYESIPNELNVSDNIAVSTYETQMTSFYEIVFPSEHPSTQVLFYFENTMFDSELNFLHGISFYDSNHILMDYFDFAELLGMSTIEWNYSNEDILYTYFYFPESSVYSYELPRYIRFRYYLEDGSLSNATETATYFSDIIIPHLKMFYGTPQQFFRAQMEISSVAYNEGYRQGKNDWSEIKYQEGFISGQDNGFQNAYDLYYLTRYNDGKLQGELETQFEYENNIIPGIQSTYQDIGFQDAFDEYYMSRYNQGLADADGNVKALTQYIPGILGVVIGFFLQLASISFAGVSILDVIVAMFAVTIALLIFKIVLGGR